MYHRPTCKGAAAISVKNLVVFDSARQAEAAGYRKAGDCGRRVGSGSGRPYFPAPRSDWHLEHFTASRGMLERQ